MAAVLSAEMPGGFHKPLKKAVVTMEIGKKGLKVSNGHAFDMEKLYARLLVISQNRDIHLQDLFRFELAPVPSALFDGYGDMRKGTKSTLVSKLTVTSSVGLPLEPVDLEIVDGNEALYHVLWPKIGTVKQFADTFCHKHSKGHLTH